MVNVVCAIAKNENLYINEWANYYLKLGFSHIYLYDNNDTTTPYVGNFIDSAIKSKITIIDKRNIHEHALQHKVYDEFYKTHAFDWCLYCDIDEFLVGVDDINNFLSQQKFKSFDQIRIRWHLFGDDDIVERDVSKPVFNFFKQIKHIPEFENQGKAIVRGKIKNVKIQSCHYATQWANGRYQALLSCLPSGKPCPNSTYRIMADYSNETIFLNHYMTKTLSEFINQKYKRGDALFVDRDIDLTYFWNINKKTKKKIDWLAQHKIKDPIKIDLVVPYVDASDPNWQTVFNKYNKVKNTEAVNAKNRFRGQGEFFRYFFRCIEKNMPWINNIFLLVMSGSQVPKWIDKTKIKIITHDQFIPEQYLPTFNSGTIEMFLQNIPGLSEYFLYANDDMYILKPLSKNAFFTENMQGKINIIEDSTAPNDSNRMWWQMCQNNHDLVFNTHHAIPYFRLDHEFRPYSRTELKNCFECYQTKIYESISQFRSAKNLTCFLFNLFMLKNNTAVKANLDESYICSTYSEAEIKKRLDKSIVCLNDTSETIDIYQLPVVTTYFKQNFTNKSKYELNDFVKVNNAGSTPTKNTRADGQANTYLYF